MYIGDYAEDFADLNFAFTTRAFATGVPTVLAGTPVIAVYKGSATGTEKTSAETYITLSVDFDGVVGLNNVDLDLSGDAFFATANDYKVVITTGTVGGVSVVGEVVGHFSIENRFMRGTDSAALASVATEARLAELDAANLPTDVAAIPTTAMRGTDGANTVVPDAAGVAPTAAENADAIWDEVLTGATHNVTNSAGKILRQVQEGGFEGGSIWIDTSVGAGGEGTITDPADDITAALVIAAATGYRNIEYVTGSSDTLVAAVEGFCIRGFGFTLALGGQSISKSRIHNATVTGIATGAVRPEFRKCNLGAVTLPPSILRQCGIGENSGQFTGGSQGDFVLKNCFSLVPGSGVPVFDFSGLGASTGINNRGWLGGATYTLDSDCTLSHEVVAGGGTTITTGGADVEIRGITRSVILVLSAAETAQFVGVTGPITLSGTTTATVNLYGVSSSLADTTSAGTVNNETVNHTAIDALPTAAENFTAVLTTQLTEAYATNGTAPTLAELLFMVQGVLQEFAWTDTTLSVKGVDGTTEKATFTSDDAANPTLLSRTT